MRLAPLLLSAAAAVAAVASAGGASASEIVFLDAPSPAAATTVRDAPPMRFREEPAAAEAAAEAEPEKKVEEAAAPEPSVAAGAFKPAVASDRYAPTCDLSAESSICAFGGKAVVLPRATEKKLVGAYDFDASHSIDSSGFQNHGSAVVPTGPGRLGRGASAYFDGSAWMEVPASESLAHAARRATASFWVYVRPDADFAVDRTCPVVLLATPEKAAWSVGLNPKQRTVSFEALAGKVAGTSLAKLRVAQWTHLALVLGRDTLSLYVNGVPDRVVQVDAAAEGAAGAFGALNLYAGRAPWEANECHVPMLMDDLRVYGRAVTSYELGAQSFGALGAVDPAFVRLGKLDATFDEARAACASPYHVCVENDLYAGALQVARTQGWANSGDKFWRGSSEGGAPDEKRIALCCMGEES